MKWLSQFARFWYDFIVGDDWTIAVAVIALLAITDIVADRGHVAWPIVPIGVAAVLSASVGRVLRSHQRAARQTGEAGKQ